MNRQPKRIPGLHNLGNFFCSDLLHPNTHLTSGNRKIRSPLIRKNDFMVMMQGDINPDRAGLALSKRKI